MGDEPNRSKLNGYSQPRYGRHQYDPEEWMQRREATQAQHEGAPEDDPQNQGGILPDRPGTGFERYLEEQLALAGGRAGGGGDKKAGGVYTSGPYKGMSKGQAIEKIRSQYEKMPDEKRLTYESEGNMGDVRSDRENQAYQQYRNDRAAALGLAPAPPVGAATVAQAQGAAPAPARTMNAEGGVFTSEQVPTTNLPPDPFAATTPPQGQPQPATAPQQGAVAAVRPGFTPTSTLGNDNYSLRSQSDVDAINAPANAQKAGMAQQRAVAAVQAVKAQQEARRAQQAASPQATTSQDGNLTTMAQPDGSLATGVRPSPTNPGMGVAASPPAPPVNRFRAATTPAPLDGSLFKSITPGEGVGAENWRDAFDYSPKEWDEIASQARNEVDPQPAIAKSAPPSGTSVGGAQAGRIKTAPTSAGSPVKPAPKQEPEFGRTAQAIGLPAETYEGVKATNTAIAGGIDNANRIVKAAAKAGAGALAKSGVAAAQGAIKPVRKAREVGMAASEDVVARKKKQQLANR